MMDEHEVLRITCVVEDEDYIEVEKSYGFKVSDGPSGASSVVRVVVGEDGYHSAMKMDRSGIKALMAYLQEVLDNG